MTDRAASPDSGSRARTHLANERTFLAWFRTGLALVALGMAAGQFLTRDVAPGIPFVRGLATILIATGGFLVAVGVYRFGRNRSRIDGDDFVPANHSVAVAAAAAAATAVLAVIFVWLIRSP